MESFRTLGNDREASSMLFQCIYAPTFQGCRRKTIRNICFHCRNSQQFYTRKAALGQMPETSSQHSLSLPFQTVARCFFPVDGKGFLDPVTAVTVTRLVVCIEQDYDADMVRTLINTISEVTHPTFLKELGI
jgi:hypothetical protein